jgi:hypothetical protein
VEGRSFCDKKTSRQLRTETSREAGLVVERKDFVQKRTQPSDRLESYHISWASVSASRSGSTADGVFVDCQASRVVVFEKQAVRDGVNIDY